MILYDLGSCSWYILPWGVHTVVCTNTTFLSFAKTGELIWQPAHYLTFLVLLHDPASVLFAQFPNWSPPQNSAHPFLLVINLCSCEKTDILEKYFKKSNFLRHYLRWGHYLLYWCILHSFTLLEEWVCMGNYCLETRWSFTFFNPLWFFICLDIAKLFLL